MRSFLTRMIGAVALALACSAGATLPAKASDDAIADWLNQLDACMPTKPISLAVVGFFQDQSTISFEQAKSVRLDVEGRLNIPERVRLEPGPDIADVIAAHEATENASRLDAEEQIRRAYDGDALVFFEEPRRTIETSITFRLMAILKSSLAEKCKKVQSGPIDLPVSTQANIKDIDKTMHDAVQQMANNAKDAKTVLICRFIAESGFSACTNALDNKLRKALDDYRNLPNTRLKERELEIQEEPAGVCDGPKGVVTAKGRFRHDPQGRSWMLIEFYRDGNYLGGSYETHISTAALSCSPSITPFLDRVEMDARRVRDQLDIAVAKSLFKQTDNLDLRIETKEPVTLYCWVLDSDGTAQVFLPVRGREAKSTLAPGEHHYPDSFDQLPVPLHEPRVNLIDCFGLRGKFPSGLEDRWMAAAPSEENKYDPEPLSAPDVSNLLEGIRAVPALVEATTRLVVR